MKIKKKFKFHFLLAFISSFVISISAFSQTTVSGEVKDEQGLPLPGATVVEKGTTNGTTSDFDGNYELQVSSPDATIIFSFIGYDNSEIGVNGQQKINVSNQNMKK